MATTEIAVPDIGDYQDVPVIEVHVAPGDVVAEEDPLVTLESDKATMDVPATAAGKVQDVKVKVGDTVSEGTVVVVVGGDGAGPLTTPPSLVDQQEPAPEETPGGPAPAPAPAAQAPPRPRPPPRRPLRQGPSPTSRTPMPAPACGGWPASSTSTSTRSRAAARRAGSSRTTCSPPSAAPPPRPLRPPPRAPASRRSRPRTSPSSGRSRRSPLPRIKKLSGPFLHRSWLNVPHVTHNDEADITELDGYRRELDTAAKAEGYRVTLLAFLMKAAVSALRQFPEVNSSLSPDKGSLILKGYHHIGIAVDTPGGLVVPVIRDVGAKGIIELSKELGAISQKARDGKLSPADMSGGTFTISSLGGIGGTGFTPIVNAPEVAILGVVRARTSPVWDGEAFQPRLMLPVSLSYDHRVIDGALAARFTRQLCNVLEDVRRLLL